MKLDPEKFIIIAALSMQKRNAEFTLRKRTDSGKKLLSFLVSEQGSKLRNSLNKKYPNIFWNDLKNDLNGYQQLAKNIQTIMNQNENVKREFLEKLNENFTTENDVNKSTVYNKFK